MADLSDDSDIPPELAEELERVKRRWSDLQPVIAAQSALIQAAMKQMQPALEAARAAGNALESVQAALGPSRDWGKRIRDGLRRAYPPNWDVDRIRLRAVQEIVARDGIPIVWVPRRAIVAELMVAGGRDVRLEILEAHYAEIISDCRRCLRGCSRPETADAVTLANRALTAYAKGIHEAGQALAVVIAERVISDHLGGGPGPGSYARAKEHARFNVHMMLAELRRAAALAPIVRFYTEWYPSSGDPAPADLSRHVSVHHPSLQQYSRPNALLALMLVVSLLREVTEWKSGSSSE